jgi:hypothetical protein
VGLPSALGCASLRRRRAGSPDKKLRSGRHGAKVGVELDAFFAWRRISTQGREPRPRRHSSRRTRIAAALSDIAAGRAARAPFEIIEREAGVSHELS